MRLFICLFYMVLLGLLLSGTSCAPRVYWPQGHGHRAALPPPPGDPAARAAYIRRLDSLTAELWSGPARILVLEEGCDYRGWSPAPAKCQQKAFPFHVSKK
jgi:hypothetical protein